MKNIVRILTLAALVAIVPMGLMAQSSSTATATANATILEPILLTHTTDLNFGDLVPSATADTMTVQTNNVRTAGANITYLGGASRGVMTVTGEDGRAFAITVNSGAGTLSNGTDSMNFTWDAACAGGNCTVAAAGTTIYLGGVLSVGVNQPAGDYTGTFDVTVAYN